MFETAWIAGASSGLGRALSPRMAVPEDRLEDLIQDVMVNVWRRAGLYDHRKASVSTRAFTIACNKRIDVVRRERRPEIDPNDPALVGPEIACPIRPSMPLKPPHRSGRP